MEEMKNATERKNLVTCKPIERKNLVTCKPTEFLSQTVKIRKAVDKWVKAIDLASIRNEKVKGLVEITSSMTKEEAENAFRTNKAIVDEHSRKNVLKIIDTAIEEYPNETLEILALACFVEPEHVDDHRVSFYLANLSDILADRDVLSFFTSLAQLEQTGILKA